MKRTLACVRDICRAATPLPSPPRRHFRHRRLLRSGTQSPNARETPLLCSRRMRRSRVPQVRAFRRRLPQFQQLARQYFADLPRQGTTAPAAAEMTTVSPAATRPTRSCRRGRFVQAYENTKGRGKRSNFSVDLAQWRHRRIDCGEFAPSGPALDEIADRKRGLSVATTCETVPPYIGSPTRTRLGPVSTYDQSPNE